jgi:recombination protein RecR
LYLPESLERLVSQFKKLPGIGEKSARRMAFSLLQEPESYVRELSESLVEMREKLHPCPECGNITDIDPCRICSDNMRDRDTLLITEISEDLISIEQSGVYNGLYHVLGSRYSPLDGEDIDPKVLVKLEKRIISLGIKEVIVATSPRIEGDMTCFELIDVLEKLDVNISRLAYGLPVGGSIEFADRVTIHAALESRIRLDRSKK